MRQIENKYQMVDLGPNILIIVLNINKDFIKSRLSDWMKKQDQMM